MSFKGLPSPAGHFASRAESSHAGHHGTSRHAAVQRPNVWILLSCRVVSKRCYGQWKKKKWKIESFEARITWHVSRVLWQAIEGSEPPNFGIMWHRYRKPSVLLLLQIFMGAILPKLLSWRLLPIQYTVQRISSRSNRMVRTHQKRISFCW